MPTPNGDLKAAFAATRFGLGALETTVFPDSAAAKPLRGVV